MMSTGTVIIWASDGKARLEIVKRDFKASGAERADLLRHSLISFSEIYRFPHLEDGMMKGRVLLLERRHQASGRSPQAKSAAERLTPTYWNGIPSLGQLPTSRAMYPIIRRVIAAATWTSLVASWRSHSGERSDAYDFFAVETDDRLVRGLDPVLLQGFGRTLDRIGPPRNGGSDRRVMEDEASPTGFLCVIECHIGVVPNVIRANAIRFGNARGNGGKR
jgi:hypothetical protein